MKTILIVEDDIDIHKLIKNILIENNYKVIEAFSGTEALMLLEKEKVDLILLDLMLPGLNGEKIIKQVNGIPIIVVSAKVSQEDKVNSLLAGANDYITKPFNSEELLARILVQLRLNNDINKNKSLKYKDIFLKDDGHTLYVKEKKVYLTKTEYAILKQLIINQNQILTKSKLLDLISYETLDCDENSLKVHISNIRKKIKAITPEEYIESIWGIGYKICEQQNLN